LAKFARRGRINQLRIKTRSRYRSRIRRRKVNLLQRSQHNHNRHSRRKHNRLLTILRFNPRHRPLHSRNHRPLNHRPRNHRLLPLELCTAS
jgi:hypothetical protein